MFVNRRKIMKLLNKLLAVVMIVCMCVCGSLSVCATSDPTPDPNAPANTRYSDIWVSAGVSTYTTVTSMTTASRYTCYMRLRWFKFSYFPSCYMPSGKYIYARLYSGNNKASSLASFSNITSPGSYNYYYWDGYGGSGMSYRLKTNSNVDSNDYEALFDWSANPYTWS